MFLLCKKQPLCICYETNRFFAGSNNQVADDISTSNGGYGCGCECEYALCNGG